MYYPNNDEGLAAQDDFLISWDDLLTHSDDCLDLVPLSKRERIALLSLCRYLEWPTRWVDLDDVPYSFVGGLENKLMSNCVDDLIKSNLLVYGALTGKDINLSENGVDAILNPLGDIVTHTGIGFDKWLNTAEGKTVAVTLQEILAAIDEIDPGEQEDYGEVLQSIASKVEMIEIVLGFVGI
jgi:hypothetical protein